MSKVRFTTFILTIILSTLILLSVILIIPTYQGGDRAFSEQLRLNYEKDQVVLNHLIREIFEGIRQIASEAAGSNDILIGSMTQNPVLMQPELDEIISGNAGERIDAFVLEYGENELLEVASVSLSGMDLPLKTLSQSYTPFNSWGVVTTGQDDETQVLLKLTLPIIEGEYGEVIAHLHTFILLNDNFWLLNELQSVTGAIAVTLRLDDWALGGLSQTPQQREVLQGISESTSFSHHDQGVINHHRLTFQSNRPFELVALLPGTAYNMFQNAYKGDLSYFILVVIILGLASVVFIHRMMRIALNNLLNHAEAVTQGELHSSCNQTFNHTFDEFDKVGEAFASMVENLRERDKRIAGIIDNTPGIIFIKDTNRRYLLANDKLAHTVGRPQDDITRMSDSDLFPEHLLEKLHETDRYVLDKGEGTQFEFTLNTAQGERTFLTSKFPLFDDDGVPYAVGGISTDITERKQFEDSLQLAQQIFEEAAEAFLVFDEDNQIITTNQAFREMTGLDESRTASEYLEFLNTQKHIRMALNAQGYWKGESELLQRDGTSLPVLLSISEVNDSLTEQKRFVAVFSDITAIKEAEFRLEKLAHFDDLTGLPNRSLFFRRLQKAISRAADSNRHTALLFMDVDHFKSINDTFGHDAGDQLLVEVADRLKHCIRRDDTLARLGGDEFTVVLSDVESPEVVEITAQRIMEALNTPLRIDQNVFHITASLGIALYPEDGQDNATLLKHADIAMYHAKDNGRNGFQFFNTRMNEQSQARTRIESGLRDAIEMGDLFVQYQPRFDVGGQKMTGAEALIRWQHPEYGLIPPSEFIPIAESSALIETIGRFVLNKACHAARRWLDEGHDVPVAVNLSTRQLRAKGIVDEVREALKSSGLPPAYLELEITETQVIHDIDQVIGTLKDLREMGVSLSVDDFGTGYSSLVYLKKLPVNTVKIDRSFVADVPGDPDDETLIEAIIGMSHSLRLSVVAEGVETQEQLDYLKGLGCDEIQGYLLARPGSPDQLRQANDAREHTEAHWI